MVQIKTKENLTDAQRETILDAVRKKNDNSLDNIESIEFDVKEDKGHITYHKKNNTKFERIRRITGYLVGTTDRWNNSKLAELRDRTKHI